MSVKYIYRLARGRAVFGFWLAGWFHSPKMKARTETMFQRLEREHAILADAASSGDRK